MKSLLNKLLTNKIVYGRVIVERVTRVAKNVRKEKGDKFNGTS